VKHFFERHKGSDLGRQLRRNRPEPRAEFLAMLSDRIEDRPRHRRGVSMRLVLVGAVTAVMLIAMSAVGGLAYAGSGVRSVAKDVQVVVVAPVAAFSSFMNSDSSKRGGGDQGGQGGQGGDHGGQGGGQGGDHGDHGHPGDDGHHGHDHEYGHKKHICHHPGSSQQDLDVDANAVPAFLGQGDFLGRCRKPGR
jgi:hypothetical protein